MVSVRAVFTPLPLGERGAPEKEVENTWPAERCWEPKVVKGLEAHPGLSTMAVTQGKAGRPKRHLMPRKSELIPKPLSKSEP